MKKLEIHKYYTLSQSEAETPKDGRCIVNSYWLVNDDGLIFYNFGDLAPQTNKNKIIANAILDTKCPTRGECQIKMIPIAYIGRDNSLKSIVKLVEQKA